MLDVPEPAPLYSLGGEICLVQQAVGTGEAEVPPQAIASVGPGRALALLLESLVPMATYRTLGSVTASCSAPRAGGAQAEDLHRHSGPAWLSSRPRLGGRHRAASQGRSMPAASRGRDESHAGPLWDLPPELHPPRGADGTHHRPKSSVSGHRHKALQKEGQGASWSTLAIACGGTSASPCPTACCTRQDSPPGSRGERARAHRAFHRAEGSSPPPHRLLQPPLLLRLPMDAKACGRFSIRHGASRGSSTRRGQARTRYDPA